MIYQLKNNLRSIRKTLGLTQIKLAELCDTTKNTISNIENYVYYPNTYLAIRLCMALNCRFEDLFYLEVSRW